MKVSLITLHHIHNYGSILQTYATQRVFEALGHTVEVVNYVRPNCRKQAILDNQAEKSKEEGGLRANPILLFALKQLWKYKYRKKETVFAQFLADYIHLSAYYEDLNELKKCPPEAEIYCTGSDQMWNSIYNNGILPEYFLEYAPDGKKKVAFSTSFGRTELDTGEMLETKRFISQYDAVSVRELSGLRILENMGYTKGVHLLDPTLLLSHAEWLHNLPITRRIKHPYVLMYQLNRNKKMLEYAKKIAQDNHCKLIKLSSSFLENFTYGKVIHSSQVTDFLSLIEFADYVVTDSFHGTAFSLNFNRQVFVWYPPKFGTRLQSILELTGQEHRVIGGAVQCWQNVAPVDILKVNEVLATERRKAVEFIMRACE